MSELRTDLTSLKTSAAGQRDPVRLRYIEALLCKYEASSGNLSALLETKVKAALSEYRQQHAAQPKPAKAIPAANQANSALGGLTSLLDSLQHATDDPDSAPLDQTLRQQEHDLADAIAQQAHQPGSSAPAPRQKELRAARRFYSAMVKLNADKVVTQAIAEVPEECGPLNPQRLATRSLDTMRQLSPHYLSRFVSYIDTLFWLEQADKSK